MDCDIISNGVNIVDEKMQDAFRCCVCADLLLHATF